MIDILAYLPAKRKQTPSGWISFSAMCCVHNGQSQDKRGRAGIKTSDQGWSYHCFNCSYTASFILGRNISFKARRLLSWLGVPDSEIELLNLESLKHRTIYGILDERQKSVNILSAITFEERDLPPFAELLTEEGKYRDYVRDRKVPEDFPIMVQNKTNGIHWRRPHVVIPFTHDNSVVGYTCRFLDNKSPKYISNTPPNYVFGTDLQKDSWEHVLVMEGIFDALCVGGLAVMHNTVNDGQVRLIRSLGKQVTVIPDQDKAGLALIDRAVELGWAVSIPRWPPGVKDVNDAVKQLGLLGTILTIFEARDTSKIKIEMKKRKLTKRLDKNAY